MLGGMRREAGTGPQQATSSISPSPTRFSRNNHGLRGYRRLTVGGEVMALDDARVQDIRDGYESRIADLEATVSALREGHADADTALLEACREAFQGVQLLCGNEPAASEPSSQTAEALGILERIL